MPDLTLAEQQSSITNKKILENAISLSNIVELATSVIAKIAGKDIADTIDRQSLNRGVLSNLVANRIKDQVLSKE